MTQTTNTLLKTPLYQKHVDADARIVDFGGWALPVNYGSQIEEHHAVRKDVGLFDVSHMTVSDINGADALPFLEKLLANDIHKATSVAGKAIYSCMLNEAGGVIDDLIIYYLHPEHCRLVTNAATNEKDMAWLQQQAIDLNVIITEQTQLALIAVQGPNAISKTLPLLESLVDQQLANKAAVLKRFQGILHEDWFIGRTGYTGEDGFEIILPGDLANTLWQALIDSGIQACGLGARDTLRLEAGMCLYGADLDETTTPLESGLDWTVSLSEERNFIGKQALQTRANRKMIGLVLQDKGVLRGHQKVFVNKQEVGEITSGTFSPTLQQSIALARIATSSETANSAIKAGDIVQVQMRNKLVDAKVVNYPFVKNGKSAI